MERDSKDLRNGIMVDFGDTNVVMFASGYGDGAYASYWGLDSKGNVANITTDFGLVMWKK